MNRAELVSAISERFGSCPKKTIDAMLSATLATIQETVAKGDKVTLVGFGTFEPRDRQAREGRNPKTGEPMTIAATTVPAFSAGKTFKEKVAANK